jgi:hypothetical protein
MESSTVRVPSGTRVVAGVLIAAAVGALAWWLFPSDERRLRSRLNELAQAASVPAGEQELGRAARLGRLGRLLSSDVVLDAGEPLGSVTGRESLLGLAAQFGSFSTGLRVELHDVTVVVGDDHRTARVEARAVATERAADGQETVEMRDVLLELTKTDEGWQLGRVTVVPERAPIGK